MCRGGSERVGECVLLTDAAHTAEKTVSSVSASGAGTPSVASAGSSLP